MSGEGRLVLWECLCSEVRDDENDLPATCPGHDRARAFGPWHLEDKPMTRGHRCLTRACPDHREDDRMTTTRKAHPLRLIHGETA